MKGKSNVTDIENYRKRSKPEVQKKQSDQKNYGPRMQSKRKKRRDSKLAGATVIFFVVSIFLLMSRYSVISKLNYEMHSLSNELEDQRNKKKELYYELEMKTNSAKVEKRAREELGMDYPKDEQIVYINVQ